MEVKELLKNKYDLEAELSEYIANRVNKFIEDSGVELRSIQVNLTGFREFGSEVPVFTTVGVEISLKI